MLERMYIKKRIASVIIAIFCLSLFSCSDDSHEPAETNLVTLKVALPQSEEFDMSSPASRNGSDVPGDAEESKIANLKFYIFSSTGLELYKVITLDTNGDSTDPMWDSTSKTLRLTVTLGNKEIFCIANSDGASGVPTIDNTITTISDLANKVRTHTSGTFTNPPVMTAHLQKTITAGDADIELKLKRQVARVEFWFKLSDVLNTLGADVKVTGVKFIKLPNTSYVFAKTPVASPGGLVTWKQTDFVGATTAALTATAEKYANKYYIPEYVPTTATDATVMVIRANYNGTTTYYRIVLDPSKSTTYPHTANLIERNHTYQYTLTIEGIGSAAEPTTRSMDSDHGGISYQLEIK